MTVRRKFEEYFSEDYLTTIFLEHIIYSRAKGIDNLDQYTFRNQLEKHVKILSRKSLSGSYRFTKYRLKLISKGRSKVPREISIPTVRDRIALRSLCNFLTDIYSESITFELPQTLIRRIKKDLEHGTYNTCIKLDVANFYPSIKHKELISRLGKKIRDNDIKKLIKSSISTPTVNTPKESDEPTYRGVPQGLAVSNILAAIYLSNIDKFFRSENNIKYYRYVDDVLIFCDHKDSSRITRTVIDKFKRIGLRIHDPAKSPDKSSIGEISNGFNYLGYKFTKNQVSVRQASIEKLKDSLVSLFTSYKHSRTKNVNFLLWRLNLRITGCVFENKSKGWLFFFSEINDEELLHKLDHYVKKLAIRFNVDIKPKRFVRTHKELRHKKYKTNYIPNFDKFEIDDMKLVLSKYFNFSIEKLEDPEIEFEFKKRINRQAKDLQQDIMNFSYSQ